MIVLAGRGTMETSEGEAQGSDHTNLLQLTTNNYGEGQTWRAS